MTRHIKVATCQYRVGWQDSWENYAEHITQLVDEAAEQQAQLLVFPEYGAMELASLFDEAIYSDLQGQLQAVQRVRDDFIRLYRELAKQYQVVIVAGSIPYQIRNGDYRNRSFVFMPDGEVAHQDKMIMTRFEREHWHIQAGEHLHAIDTPLGKLGIIICYDSEFPLLARRLVEQGADILVCPSCTDGWAGYYRVRLSCQARAIENQCYVIQSPTVGDAQWSPAIDENRGLAAIFSPADYGFPDDGVIAIGTNDFEGWVYGELDLHHIQSNRHNGQVVNFKDWTRQFPSQ